MTTIAIEDALQGALKLCSDIERNIVALGKLVDHEQKLELVQLRRRFAEEIGQLGNLIATDMELGKQPEKREEMNRLFSSFRFAIGQHQASWPAVRIGEDVAAYSASAKATYAKTDMFWNWCTQNLDFHRH